MGKNSEKKPPLAIPTNTANKTALKTGTKSKPIKKVLKRKDNYTITPKNPVQKKISNHRNMRKNRKKIISIEKAPLNYKIELKGAIEIINLTDDDPPKSKVPKKRGKKQIKKTRKKTAKTDKKTSKKAEIRQKTNEEKIAEKPKKATNSEKTSTNEKKIAEKPKKITNSAKTLKNEKKMTEIPRKIPNSPKTSKNEEKMTEIPRKIPNSPKTSKNEEKMTEIPQKSINSPKTSTNEEKMTEIPQKSINSPKTSTNEKKTANKPKKSVSFSKETSVMSFEFNSPPSHKSTLHDSSLLLCGDSLFYQIPLLRNFSPKKAEKKEISPKKGSKNRKMLRKRKKQQKKDKKKRIAKNSAYEIAKIRVDKEFTELLKDKESVRKNLLHRITTEAPNLRLKLEKKNARIFSEEELNKACSLSANEVGVMFLMDRKEYMRVDKLSEKDLRSRMKELKMGPVIKNMKRGKILQLIRDQMAQESLEIYRSQLNILIRELQARGVEIPHTNKEQLQSMLHYEIHLNELQIAKEHENLDETTSKIRDEKSASILKSKLIKQTEKLYRRRIKAEIANGFLCRFVKTKLSPENTAKALLFRLELFQAVIEKSREKFSKLVQNGSTGKNRLLRPEDFGVFEESDGTLDFSDFMPFKRENLCSVPCGKLDEILKENKAPEFYLATRFVGAKRDLLFEAFAARFKSLVFRQLRLEMKSLGEKSSFVPKLGGKGIKYFVKRLEEVYRKSLI